MAGINKVKYKTYIISYQNGKNRKVKGLLTEIRTSVGGRALKGEVIVAQIGNEVLTKEETIDINCATVTTKG